LFLLIFFFSFFSCFINIRIPITANKLTSAVVLESLEASEVALCPTEQSRVAEGGNSWKTALTALHGDDFTVPAVDIRMKQAAYCKAACLLDLTADNADTLQKWHAAIRNEFQVQWYFDGVPTGVRIEDEYVGPAIADLCDAEISFENRHGHSDRCVLYVSRLA
jgi:hypothetical protein